MAQENRETIEFPYVLVRNSFEILMKQGVEAFRKYANAVNMPTEDISRVLSKKKYMEDPEYRAKIKKIAQGISRKMSKTYIGGDVDCKDILF